MPGSLSGRRAVALSELHDDPGHEQGQAEKDAEARAKLAKKVADAVRGLWGTVLMPPNKGKVSEADIKTLVDWILAQ